MKKITAGVLLAALCATLFASCAIYRVPEDLRVAVFDNLTKIRREEKLPIAAERDLSVSLARNESEGMQFVLNSATQDFKVKNVTVSDLANDDGSAVLPASDISVYRQHYMYVDVHYYTYKGYPDGYYPDALIEQKYDLAHYADGLPVAKGDNQGYWLTVKAGKGLPAGRYTGKVTVETDVKTLEIPVTCTVWDFDIPDEVHFKNAYALYGLNDYEGQRVQYYNFLKEYRLTSCYLPINEENYRVYKSTDDYLSVLPNVDNNLTTSAFFNLGYRRVNKMVWTCSDCGHEEVTDSLSDDFVCPDCGADAEKFQNWICRNCRTYYTGRTLPEDYVCKTCGAENGGKYCDYCGALYSKSEAPSSDVCPKCGHEDLNNTFKQYKQHYFNEDFKETLAELAKTNLNGKMYALTHDEPKYQLGPNWANDVLQFNGDVNRELPWITSVVTFDDKLPTAGSSDGQKVRYLPGAWCIKPSNFVEGDTEDLHKHGQELWFYTCNWPTYPAINTHIDSYSSAARILHWIEYDYDIDGYFCYAATSADRDTNAEHPDPNPWINPYAHLAGSGDGNEAASDPAGDGYLIMIGKEGDGIIDDNVPVPTIRLEVMRDGMEDYEYLRLYEQKLNALIEKYNLDITADDALQMFFAGLYKDTADWSLDTQRLYYTREKLAELITADDDFICFLDANANEGVINIFTNGNDTVKINGKIVNGENGRYKVNVTVDETLYLNEFTVSVGNKERTLFVFPDKLNAVKTLVTVDGNEAAIAAANKKAVVTATNGKITAQLTEKGKYFDIPVSAMNTNVDLSEYTHIRMRISQNGSEMTDELIIGFRSSFSTYELTVEKTESGTYVDIPMTETFINNALKKKPRTIRITPAIEKEMTITVSDIQLINKTAQDPKLKENAGIK